MFLQSGRLENACFGRPCCHEPALEIADWVMNLQELLMSTVRQQGTVIIEGELKHLQNLVESVSEGKSATARQE